ncbi:MAG: glycosyltransferase, partial [Bacteroidetes bacterium]|nr:glycosyltransferase [Bacteroidota bacterium]
MTILYFYQYFSTPNGSFGTRVFEFSKRWAKKGDKIIVVTSIYDKSDLKASGISSKLNYEGVEVRVLNIVISNKYSFLYRIWTFFAYAILSSYYALVIKCDVIIASSGPITVGIPGLVGRYLRGRKLIFEVRDLWPEGAVQMGILNNKSLQKLAYAFEKWCYTAARKVVTLSPGMQNEI